MYQIFIREGDIWIEHSRVPSISKVLSRLEDLRKKGCESKHRLMQKRDIPVGDWGLTREEAFQAKIRMRKLKKTREISQ
jgi:hypothetical protein